MDRDFLLAKRHHSFRELTDEQIRRILGDCETLELATDETVYRAGEPLEHIYFLARGKLVKIIQDRQGRQKAQQYLSPGEQFGAVAAAQLEPVPITVTAAQPSIVFRLGYARFLEYVGEFPQLLLNLIRDVGTAFKKTLDIDRRNRRPKVVLVVHESPASRPLTHRLIDRLGQLGESPVVLTDDPGWQARPEIPQVLMVRDGEWLSPDRIRAQVAEWSSNERVIIDIAGDVDRERLIQGMMLAEKALFVARPEEAASLQLRLKEVVQFEPEWRESINVAWMLEPPRMHAPWVADLNQLCSFVFRFSFSEPAPNCGPVLTHGIERIIHELRGVRIGIALGGGAARGMAHLGVLKALEQNGIVVDMIAGTSAGAMTGTVYAAGLDVDYAVKCFVHDLTPSWWFKRLRHGGYWYLLYQYRRGQFDPLLRQYLFDWRLEQLCLPMNTITVDLVSGEPKIRVQGDAVRGILESINLPGLSPPICRDGQALVDGGLINNVPADVLVSRGCNYVIAVSVTGQLEQEFADIRPDSHRDKYRAPSVMQTILRGYLVQSVNMNAIGVQPADMIVDIDVTDFDLSEFTRTDELAAVGHATTLSSLESLRRSLAHLDPQLFANEETGAGTAGPVSAE